MNILGWRLPKLDPISILTIIAFAIAGGIIGWFSMGAML